MALSIQVCCSRALSSRCSARGDHIRCNRQGSENLQLIEISSKPSGRSHFDCRRLQDQLKVKFATLAKQIILKTKKMKKKFAAFDSLHLGDGPFTLVEEDLELPLEYSPEAIEIYFKTRPREVWTRVLVVISQCSIFVMNIMLDNGLGLLKQNERVRAAEFLNLVTGLGPTAIKIGQALSIRPDILSSAYLEQLQKLQDRVDPFSNQVAMEMIENEIGKDVFSEISSDPVAAGSLGQVYKARLRASGDVVAVKVQRPGVLRLIACDLLILRQTACILNRLSKSDTGFVELLDSWAVRFFDELDYCKEARNAQRFTRNMSSLPMIVTPEVYMDHTTYQVLTTKWIYGEKLSEIKEGDVLSLVKTALSCYLMQLLENGFIHADPHPGNLLRTADGRLCILDFGLMTEVTEDQQLAMIEYLAHVFNSDYHAVAEDLVRLGFLPSHSDPNTSSAIVPEVTRIFTELLRGGGARKLNMKEITDGIAKISQDYRLVIPPYFSLIVRTFTLLEGIGLEVDPDYAIIRECYPYVAKRLVTDDSSRMREVLKYFLYSESNQLNVTRLEQMMASFQDFQQLMTPENKSAAEQALFLLLDPKGSFFQELALAEFVRLADAVSRTARLQLLQFFVSVLNLPIPSSVVGVGRLSQEDRNSIETMQRLWPLLQPYLFSQHSGTVLASFARQIIPSVPDLFPGASIFAQKFLIMFLQRQALRYADELTGKNVAVVEWDKDPAAFVRKIPWARVLDGARSLGEATGRGAGKSTTSIPSQGNR